MMRARNSCSSAVSVASFGCSVKETTRAPKKYEYVKSAIDSGCNMRKLSEKFPEAKINARFKKEEIFRRMKTSTMVKLLNEKQVECLILDIRDREQFQTCHLKGATSYPATLLKKSVNVFTIDILNFINKEPQKIIIFYDEDEHAAISAGNLFVEKGIENIFMLSGGLREMSLNYPEMVEGILPRPTHSCPATPFRGLTSRSSHAYSGNSLRSLPVFRSNSNKRLPFGSARSEF